VESALPTTLPAAAANTRPETLSLSGGGNTFSGVNSHFSFVAGLGKSWVEGESSALKTDLGATYTVQKTSNRTQLSRRALVASGQPSKGPER
jgi:hypothetical protein